MAPRDSIPLRHPFLEAVVPGPDTPDKRAEIFKRPGEWPHAVSAMMESARRGTDSGLPERLEDLRQRWRLHECDHDAADRLRLHGFKRLMAEIRARGPDDGVDLVRNGVYLREAYRRNPDNAVVQHLLSITYLAFLDAGSKAAEDPAYRDYLKVDDVNELAARVDHLVARRSGVPHWLVVCPNASGTWQLRNYIRHLETLGRSRFLLDTHKYRSARYAPLQRDDRKLPWLIFTHLSTHTDMRFVIAGNLHDPIQALLYTITRKSLAAHHRANGDDDPLQRVSISGADLDALRDRIQKFIDQNPVNNLAAYFHLNDEHAFGMSINAFQIRHKRHGYFIGFRDNLTFVVTRLLDLDVALPMVLENVLCVDTTGCRPRATSG